MYQCKILLPVKDRDMGLGSMSNFINKWAYDQRSKSKDRMYVYYQNYVGSNHD